MVAPKPAEDATESDAGRRFVTCLSGLAANPTLADDSTEPGANQQTSKGPSGPEVVEWFEDGSTEPGVDHWVAEGPSGLEAVQRFADGSIGLEIESQHYLVALRSFLVRPWLVIGFIKLRAARA